MNFKNLSNKKIISILNHNSNYFKLFPENTEIDILTTYKGSYSIKESPDFYAMNFENHILSIILRKDHIAYARCYLINPTYSTIPHYTVDLNPFTQFVSFNKLKKEEWFDLNQNELCELIRYLDRIKNLSNFL